MVHLVHQVNHFNFAIQWGTIAVIALIENVK